jgi:regulatory protein
MPVPPGLGNLTDMTVTRIEDTDKSKVRIYIDGEYAFTLYQKDIGRYRLEEGKELPDDVYHTILEETLLHRAKEKAMALLKLSDRTESELHSRLITAGFPEQIIDLAVSYVCSYGYINDERYAASYVNLKMGGKSKALIRMELLRKGIKKEIIDKVLFEEYENKEEEDPEIKAIRKLIAKKCNDPDMLSWEDKQNLIASLYRKGFTVDKITDALKPED